MGLIKFIRDLWEITHLNTDKKVNIPYGLSDIEDIYRKKEFSTDEIRILMITDFSEFLDNYTPIFAVNECNKEGMNIQLDIYGQGRDLNKIQNCIKNQNCKNIRYKGGFQDFTPLYKDYDIFITSSYSCDIQMNTIEAMRAGLPLLLMDIKGNGESEFIKGNGYLMPENAIMLYRKTLKSFYDDKTQLITMGQNSRKQYEERYKPKNRKPLLGINIDLLNKKQVLNLLRDKLILNNNEIFCVSPLNIEVLMRANNNKNFKDYLNNTSNLNPIDGVGILNVFKWYGLNSYERICGSDLAYDLAQMCQENGKKYFILGSAEDISEQAKIKLQELYNGLNIENYSPPYTKNIDFSDDENNKIKKIIQNTKPDVLCVAFGALKQELWIKNNLDFLKDNGVKIAIGLGGSFDFIAGKVDRAPAIFQRTGNEWLYRLMKEPKNRFRRQITTIPKYYFLCFREFFKEKVFYNE